MTLIPSIIAGAILFFAKKGKPDGYLGHLIQYYTTPGFYSAGAKSNNAEKKEFKIYEKKIRIT